jgi:TPR repeat protein
MKYILILTVLLTSTAFAAPDFDETMAAAKQGEAYAQNNLGAMYDNGVGIAEDYAEAVKWYHKAADQGNAEAQFNLALMYDNGKGVPENDSEAVKWYRKAAADGDQAAQFNLGYMYDHGEGTPEDDKEAVKWYRKAADQGLAEAQYNLGIMYAKSGDGVSQNDAEAFKWNREAARQGFSKAQSDLGFMYATGTGVPIDNIRAYVWWVMAIIQGDARSSASLDWLKPKMAAQKIVTATDKATKCYESKYKDCD